MCTIIDADYLLATVLSTREQVSFRFLSELQSRIERQVPNVVVNMSSTDLDSALEYYPEIFERRQGLVAQAPNAGQYLSSKYYECEFVSSVPANVHAAVKQAIEASP